MNLRATITDIRSNAKILAATLVISLILYALTGHDDAGFGVGIGILGMAIGILQLFGECQHSTARTPDDTGPPASRGD